MRFNGRFLSTAWHSTRQHKTWWFLGLLGVLGGGGGSMTRLLLPLVLPAGWWPDFNTLENQILYERTSLLWGALFFFLLFLGGWLLAVWAEGGLIAAVVAEEEQRPFSLRASLDAGTAVLGRFIAIDALVFFPLFLLLLLILLIVGGSIAGAGLAAVRTEEIGGVLLALGVGGVCTVPLLILLLPVGALSLLVRTLAFRDAVLFPHGVREGIGHTLAVMRRQVGAVLLVTAVVWGVQYGFSVGVTAVSWPLTALLLRAEGLLRGLLLAGSVGGALLLLLAETILHTFTAVVWTKAYLHMVDSMEIGD